VARRSLATLAGLPEPERLAVEPPNLSPSDSEETLLQEAFARRPELQAAQERVRQFSIARRGAWLAFLPTLSAFGTQTFTNAEGFAGEESAWTVGATADWLLLDFGTRWSDVKRGRAALARMEAVLKQERDRIRDEVHAARLDVEASRAKAIASRAAADLSRATSIETLARFRAGTATQLEVIQSDRDALSAEVERIRSEGELAIARFALRHAAGNRIRP
jgi:outer membrane protein TolC